MKCMDWVTAVTRDIVLEFAKDNRRNMRVGKKNVERLQEWNVHTGGTVQVLRDDWKFGRMWDLDWVVPVCLEYTC